MISTWITIGLIISAASVASLGAYFSIMGLGALFSGAVLAVCVMAGALEFAKFTLAAYLHQVWHNLNKLYRGYLVFSVVVLSLITSMGIFGFLSESYQSASIVLEAETIKLESVANQQKSITAEVARLTELMDEIPENRVSRRMKMRAEVEPLIKELNKKFEAGAATLAAANLKILDVKKKVGPLIYIARMFDMNIDSVVKYLILTLVLVFDPLAICLVIASTHAIESRRQIKGSIYENKQEAKQETKPETRPEVKVDYATAPEKNIFNPVKVVLNPESKVVAATQPEAAPEDVIVQMNFKDENEDKKAV
ncbi:MAG: hypothetical protein AABY53_05150 [Bdellovibrionota bacterium]